MGMRWGVCKPDRFGYGCDNVYTEEEFEAFVQWNDAWSDRDPMKLLGAHRSGRGYRLLHELARAAQVNGAAAFGTQFSEFNGDDWQWEGTRLLTVYPDGGHRITELFGSSPRKL